MFYSQFILAKKGPLGTIWIAAHLERKLRKNQVADTDIGVSVDSILFPDVPIALRLSSHLLLGVVRIYSRKVSYLFDDCSEALLKVKQAFRSAAVDLPPEQSKAPYHSITLPETFDLDDFELPDNEIFQGNYVDHHVSSREQITLQDSVDGGAFPTSQFGPDERFGDGDASQIGLDLDEDLFLEKGEAAGTSDILNNTDFSADQASAKEATSFKDDEHRDGVSDLPLASSTNYFSIQAPSTPGLMEEPNLPGAQEALVSDDHMDEDQHIYESAAHNLSGKVEPSRVLSPELHSNGDCHHFDEQENEQLRSEIPLNEASQMTSTSNAQHIEAVIGVDRLGNKINCSPLQNEGSVADDSQSTRGRGEHDELCKNRAENGIFTEVHDRDTSADSGKVDRNGAHLPDQIRSENNNSLVKEGVSSEETEMLTENKSSQSQTVQPSQSLENFETSECNGLDNSSVISTPVLKACNSHVRNVCGVEKSADVSNLSTDDAEPGSMGLTLKEGATNISEISTDVHDIRIPTLEADQIAHDNAGARHRNLDGNLENDNSGEDNLEQENNTKVSDLSPRDKMLSMPNLPAGQADNVLVEFTPGIEAPAGDGDASVNNLLSGRKRSFTESTLTIQSLNSAESSGAAQSKQSAELVPEDDDLLSSILDGRRSTTFKLKPSPPVADSLPAKRQRTSVRSSALKRKVLVDDSMVLHGDMIREQLTNTEDICRVRKKAPCTRLEVWVLQKQFLEDEVFNEPVFPGFFPELSCLYSQQLDLRRIRIVKGTSENSQLKHAEGNDTQTPAVCGTERQESMFVVDGSTLQKELETFDNEVAKQMSKQHASVKNLASESHDLGNGAGNPAASAAEPTSSLCPVPEVSYNSTDNAKVGTPDLNETADIAVSVDFDASRQSINQDHNMESTKEDASTMEEVSGSGRREEEVVDVNVSEIPYLDGKLDGESSLDKREGIDTTDTVEAVEDVQGTCSSPVYDVQVTNSVEFEGRASPTAEKDMDESPVGQPGFATEEVIVSDIGHVDSCLTSNNLAEDQSNMIDVDSSSQDNKVTEKDDLECLEMDPTFTSDPMTIPTEVLDPADHTGFGTEAFEHDTDFLNVDDDDVAEDYEGDMPNPEEKRILDNSGWSARTRAVANYFQVLFEKETHPAKKAIPLESLLAGKSRKEASRLFFETLVLKSKDYILTEQDSSFCDIKIKPTGKLTKSEF